MSHPIFHRRLAGAVAAFATLAAMTGASVTRGATTDTIEVVAYNIEDDIDGYTTPRPGLDTVLEAIGDQTYNGIPAQPIDILALEETTSNAATVAPIVTDLNSYYGAGTYAMATYQDTTEGGDLADGNGPNALVYDTKVVSLIGTEQVSGTPTSASPNANPVSGSTIYRGVMRYEFEPVGGTTANAFYVYVSHTKSGSGSTDASDRSLEATAIRNDAANLPANSSILYVGDFNLGGSSEAAYKTLTGTGSGTGQAIDPLNTANNYNLTFSGSSYPAANLTESATNLTYRDDIQFMTSNVYNGTSGTGLNYDSGTYRAFGNNGSVGNGGSVTDSGNTGLNGVSDPGVSNSTIEQDLTTASDHLPIVADYSITVAVPEPSVTSLLALTGLLALVWRFRTSQALRPAS